MIVVGLIVLAVLLLIAGAEIFLVIGIPAVLGKLMDGADPELLRRVGIRERHRFAFEEDFPRVWLVDA